MFWFQINYSRDKLLFSPPRNDCWVCYRVTKREKCERFSESWSWEVRFSTFDDVFDLVMESYSTITVIYLLTVAICCLGRSTRKILSFWIRWITSKVSIPLDTKEKLHAWGPLLFSFYSLHSTGYRYELFCLIKHTQTPHCVVSMTTVK